MRLLEAILDANHRALTGDTKAGLHPRDYEQSLPLVALTCIDSRLNRFFPDILALPDEQFIWLRNAGNIITSPTSSTMRSLALACAVKGGREIAVIGHTDCRIRQTTITSLIDRFKEIGVDRSALPENLTEFFGVFASEQQNVMRAVDHIRASPLIGPAIPIHGLMADVKTGRLDWVVNGYDVLGRATAKAAAPKLPEIGRALDDMAALGSFNLGEMKFPETRIGQAAQEVKHRVEEAREVVEAAKKVLRPMPPAPAPSAPPPPLPARPAPPIAPPIHVTKTGKWGMRD